MFKLFDVDRRTLTLLMIVLVACLTTLQIPAEEVENFGRPLSMDLGGQAFEDPDEDAPDPDPFEDPDEDAPDPDPFEDPDEDAPDPDPLAAEVYPLVLARLTTVLFQMDGPALATLHNAAGHRLFVAGDGSEVMITLAAGVYELRIEGGKEARGAVQLHLERVP